MLNPVQSTASTPQVDSTKLALVRIKQVSGSNVCGWSTGALYEQHITGDVAMAFRQQYYLSRNVSWLSNHAWPVIRGAAEFWASRFVRDTGSGNYTIKAVTGPDESSGKVDDEA
jgi:trehalose/maltose hydrolase-like predicted phosphorylase